MKNKQVKQMIANSLTSKWGFMVDWINHSGDYLTLIAYGGDGYAKLCRQFLRYQDNGKLHALRNPYAEY